MRTNWWNNNLIVLLFMHYDAAWQVNPVSRVKCKNVEVIISGRSWFCLPSLHVNSKRGKGSTQRQYSLNGCPCDHCRLTLTALRLSLSLFKAKSQCFLLTSPNQYKGSAQTKLILQIKWLWTVQVNICWNIYGSFFYYNAPLKLRIKSLFTITDLIRWMYNAHHKLWPSICLHLL